MPPIARRLFRHPWRWALAALATLALFPQIDLTVAGWFFEPLTKTFPARIDPLAEWVRLSMPAYLFASVPVVAALWGLSEWRKRRVCGINRRVAAYLLLSLALGPGLVVNVVLKDYWGRPRPSTIEEFGGSNHYVRPLLISDQCDHNCSFSSGHGALGFWPMAFALIAPISWRGRAIAIAAAFGVGVGFVRIAQGGHFVSDVAFSAAITIGIILWLRRALLEAPEKICDTKAEETP